MKNDFEIEVDTTTSNNETKESLEVQKWLEEVHDVEKREKKWRDEGYKVIELYEAERKVDYQFNILYSNTETLAPALYSTTPTPIVQRRFKDDDPVGLEASKVTQRMLSYFLDNGMSMYATFDSLMISSVLSTCVPGRGVVRFKYDAEITPDPVVAPENDIDSRPEMTVPGTVEDEIKGGSKIEWEACCGEAIPWDRFGHGYASNWADVPYIFYKWPMTREELIKNFGQEVGNKVSISTVSDKELEDSKDQSARMMRGMKIAWVYEVWNKATKEVIFLTEGYREGPLKKVPDPLNLTGFFNCPQPLTFFQRVSSLLPQTLYAFYEEQAKELNVITKRINRILGAMKVRGIYDGSIDALGRVFEQDDNALIAADNTTAMYDRGGIEKAIWLLPIDKFIIVLQQLYIAREQIKQVIYEITGLSDILRGSSNPNETLGAQKIKDQWGNLRLRRQQKRVQTFVVESLRIMAEIGCTKFGLDSIKQITNLKYPMAAEKQAAQQRIQQIQHQAQSTGQQPPPMPPDIEEMLSMPTWEEIMQVLQNDIVRSYRIDIETNSTLEPEATEDKESMMGLMNALSQFLLGVQPLVADGSLPFDAMRAILLTITRRFNFGDQVEDELKKMQAPQPKPQEPSPEMVQAQKQIETQGQQLQQQQVQFEKDKSDFANQVQSKSMELDNRAKQNQMNLDFEKQETLMEIDFAKKEALNEIKFSKQEADHVVKQVANNEELKLHVKSTIANLQQGAKEVEFNNAQQDFASKQAQDAKEPKRNAMTPVIDTIKQGQDQHAQGLGQLADAIGQMAKSMESFVTAHKAEKTITDMNGKSYTVKTGK